MGTACDSSIHQCPKRWYSGTHHDHRSTCRITFTCSPNLKRNPHLQIRVFPCSLHGLTNSGRTITETISICATLATQFPEARLWTKDLADAIEFTLLGSMEKLTSTDPVSVREALKAVNEALVFSMHPVKYAFTVADLCLWGAIKGNPLVSNEMSGGKYIEIERWHKEFMEPEPITAKVYKLVRDLTVVL